MSEIGPPCPKCGKGNVTSNLYDSECAARNLGHHVGGGGNPWIAGLAGGLWLIQQGINYFSHSWVCNDCGHTFSPQPPVPAETDSEGESKATTEPAAGDKRVLDGAKEVVDGEAIPNAEDEISGLA